MPRRDEPLITIARFETSTEAVIACGALEAIGIRALVPEEAIFRRGVVVSPASLQVFASDEQRALVELRRMQIRMIKTEQDPP